MQEFNVSKGSWNYADPALGAPTNSRKNLVSPIPH